ncbi:MAG: hypothetical protein RL377_256, partial [Bacteroidota bacterium]
KFRQRKVQDALQSLQGFVYRLNQSIRIWQFFFVASNEFVVAIYEFYAAKNTLLFANIRG